MKKHKFIVLGLLLILIAIPALSFAISMPTKRALGGRVITTPPDTAALIVCTVAYGPFSVLPVNPAIPGPFYIENLKSGTPTKNKWVLALYETIPSMDVCNNPETGVPIPAFKIKIYGVSR